jgi:predicted nucleotidyltransferase
VYVFGSAATGSIRRGSDIDLAIRGCPTGQFFELLAKLFMALSRPVDLVDLDHQEAFGKHLETEGHLVRIG